MKQYLTNIKIANFSILFLILMCVISRLPQLCSPELFLDPDECITALMAKYWSSGEDCSLFFWGQNYGLTIIEILFILPFAFCFGYSTLSVKLAMLLLWTIGVLFLFKTLKLIFKNRSLLYPLLLTLLFISFPAWAVWSMKARGGYLTSFTAGFIITYFLFKDSKTIPLLHWFVVGLLLQIVFQSQLFWLVGIIPLMLLFLFKDKMWLKLLGLITGICSLGIPFYFYKKSINVVYNPPIIIPKMEDWKMYLFRFPKYVYDSLHGHYYFSFYFEPGTASSLVAFITIWLLSLLLLRAVVSLFTQRKWVAMGVSTLYIFGFFFISTIMVYQEGRYFLPISCFLMITLAFYLQATKRNFLLVAILLATMFFGFKGLYSFRNNLYSGNKKESVMPLIRYLQSRNISACFSKDCMLPWQIIFYSQETIAARIPFQSDRYPKFHRMVDSVFNNGGPTAIVGLKTDLPQKITTPIKTLQDFYIIENPSLEEVKSSFP